MQMLAVLFCLCNNDKERSLYSQYGSNLFFPNAVLLICSWFKWQMRTPKIEDCCGSTSSVNWELRAAMNFSSILT